MDEFIQIDVPNFLETHYLHILLSLTEDKLLPDFYKYFELPREAEWKQYLDEVKKMLKK